MDHAFTAKIRYILETVFGDIGQDIFEKSSLLRYLNEKTKSANRGAKARASFGTLYALYVLLQDYISYISAGKRNYSGDYEGANFTRLMEQQRRLPFGTKLQNHALNNRVNSEFRKFFPTETLAPIVRDQETNRYWINENLLLLNIGGEEYNLAEVSIQIIEEYIKAKTQAFRSFIQACEDAVQMQGADDSNIKQFILTLLAPNADARIFEIVSYAILKYYYYYQVLYFGFDPNTLSKENLRLYKTGRTNANDGGIDFVMRPLGRFFQVTETLDVRKYFLDIDKTERYPITFVIKSNEDNSALRLRIETGARRLYAIEFIVQRYMASVEEIINIPTLIVMLTQTVSQGYLSNILDEIIKQSRIEYNMDDADNVSP